jgi:hypothetical protein
MEKNGAHAKEDELLGVHPHEGTSPTKLVT